MLKLIVTATVFVATAISAGAAIRPGEAQRLAASARTIQQLRGEVPDDVWMRARCVIALPELKKAAFIIGGEYGKGVMSCRAGDKWSAPVFMQLAKGSWGFQAGVEQADLVVLVMNEKGVQKLLDNKVTLGADASLAAGPIGRRAGAGTDAALAAEMLAYSRSKGLFAGLDVSGGILRPDDDVNVGVFGTGATPRTILANSEISAPPEAAPFLRALSAAGGGGNVNATGSGQSASAASVPRGAPVTTDDDLRARVVDIQQTVDRLLADTTPAPVGTSGSADSIEPSTVRVERARLLQLRQQLEALLASLNRR